MNCYKYTNVNVSEHFKVNDAILRGVQNYSGERKIYSKCMQKVGSFDTPDNSGKVDFLQFL